MPQARIPVILFAVYFMPAVLRAWLQLYWQLRGDVRADQAQASFGIIG